MFSVRSLCSFRLLGRVSAQAVVGCTHRMFVARAAAPSGEIMNAAVADLRTRNGVG